MSALAAIVHKSRVDIVPERIDTMLAGIPLGGVVTKAAHVTGPFGLGAATFATMTPPIARKAGLFCALDGRLDDREDLVATLGADPHLDDASLLLAAYRRWEAECVTRLAGDFAFFIHDAATRTTLCGRDILGVRPLYYHDSADALYLASHPGAILAALPRIAAAADQSVLAAYAAGYAPEGDRTLYPAIRRLMPGHRLASSPAGCTIDRYADWSSERRPTGREPPVRFAALLDRAVSRRMAGTGPVAALLSGGLDSSSVVALARHHRQSLRTYSQVFPAYPEADERPFIATITDGGGLDPQFLDCTGISTFDGLDRALTVQAGPFIGPNLATTTHTYRTAAAQGFPILLDGHGGDESVYSGLGSLYDHAYNLRWLSLWREVQAIARLDGIDAPRVMTNLLRRRGPFTRRTQQAKVLAGQPRPAWLAHDVPWPPQPPRLPQPGHEAYEEHLASFTSSFFVQALELLAHASASEGIELRFPLLDRDLIAWCLAAPAEEKFRHGYSRALLRQGMVEHLPARIRERRDKFDFSSHVIRGMTATDQAMIGDILADRDDRLRPFFDMTVLRDRWNSLQHQPEAVDGFTMQAIWRAIVLGRWLDRPA